MSTELELTRNFCIVLGALAAVARTLRAAPAGQSLGKTLVTLIGSVLTCCGVVWMVPHFRHLVPNEAIGFFVNLATQAMADYAPIATRMLRDWAAKFHGLAEAETGPGGDSFVRAKYNVLGCLMYLLVGVVDIAQSVVPLMRW